MGKIIETKAGGAGRLPSASRAGKRGGRKK